MGVGSHSFALCFSQPIHLHSHGSCQSFLELILDLELHVASHGIHHWLVGSDDLIFRNFVIEARVVHLLNKARNSNFGLG